MFTGGLAKTGCVQHLIIFVDFGVHILFHSGARKDIIQVLHYSFSFLNDGEDSYISYKRLTNLKFKDSAMIISLKYNLHGSVVRLPVICHLFWYFNPVRV